MPRNHDTRRLCVERLEHARPIRRVNVDLVRRKPREDREHPFLHQVAHENDAAIGHMHRLIAERMRLSCCAQFDAATAEIDRGARPAIDFIRLNDCRPLERRGDRRPERAKHAEKSFALAPELVPLRFVVDDLGDALENLRAEAVLGWKWVGSGSAARPRQVFGDLKHLGPVRGPHARINDERRVVSETIPIFGTKGTRLSPMTKTPLAISLSALGSTFGGGGVSSMSLIAFVVREGVSRRDVVASGHGHNSRRKADFAAPRNALGSIKNDDEHEKRESAVA